MPKPEASRQNGQKGGRPAGTKNAGTISKEMAREALRQVVLKHMDDMVAAQVANAQGLKYLVARQKNGKFERVTQAEVEAILDGGDEERVTLEVWEKDPSVQAFTDLMNRALDKPKEQEQDIHANVSLQISWQP